MGNACRSSVGSIGEVSTCEEPNNDTFSDYGTSLEPPSNVRQMDGIGSPGCIDSVRMNHNGIARCRDDAQEFLATVKTQESSGGGRIRPGITPQWEPDPNEYTANTTGRTSSTQNSLTRRWNNLCKTSSPSATTVATPSALRGKKGISWSLSRSRASAEKTPGLVQDAQVCGAKLFRWRPLGNSGNISWVVGRRRRKRPRSNNCSSGDSPRSPRSIRRRLTIQPPLETKMKCPATNPYEENVQVPCLILMTAMNSGVRFNTKLVALELMAEGGIRYPTIAGGLPGPEIFYHGTQWKRSSRSLTAAPLSRAIVKRTTQYKRWRCNIGRQMGKSHPPGGDFDIYDKSSESTSSEASPRRPNISTTRDDRGRILNGRVARTTGSRIATTLATATLVCSGVRALEIREVDNSNRTSSDKAAFKPKLDGCHNKAKNPKIQQNIEHKKLEPKGIPNSNRNPNNSIEKEVTNEACVGENLTRTEDVRRPESLSLQHVDTNCCIGLDQMTQFCSVPGSQSCCSETMEKEAEEVGPSSVTLGQYTSGLQLENSETPSTEEDKTSVVVDNTSHNNPGWRAGSKTSRIASTSTRVNASETINTKRGWMSARGPRRTEPAGRSANSLAKVSCSPKVVTIGQSASPTIYSQVTYIDLLESEKQPAFSQHGQPTVLIRGQPDDPNIISSESNIGLATLNSAFFDALEDGGAQQEPFLEPRPAPDDTAEYFESTTIKNQNFDRNGGCNGNSLQDDSNESQSPIDNDDDSDGALPLSPPATDRQHYLPGREWRLQQMQDDEPLDAGKELAGNCPLVQNITYRSKSSFMKSDTRPMTFRASTDSTRRRTSSNISNGSRLSIPKGAMSRAMLLASLEASLDNNGAGADILNSSALIERLARTAQPLE